MTGWRILKNITATASLGGADGFRLRRRAICTAQAIVPTVQQENTFLTYETLDRIILRARLGTYTYIFSGGEPTMRKKKKDLIRLAEAHPDCAFLAFTNGTLVDEEFADELKRVGNFALRFSIEGNEEDTDFRRGAGALIQR